MPHDDDQQWVVLKYGGTSVSTAETWRAIAERARQVLKEGCNVWITVSAITQVTNKVRALARSGN
jgi:aspartokinase